MDNDFRYAGIDKYEYVNGNGIGVTLYMQGCTHHCDGCHNPETWGFNGGKEMDSAVWNDLFDTLNDDNIKRLTLSGGDPFDNIVFARIIAWTFKFAYPNKKLWIYTGYTYEKIRSNEKMNALLKYCDILVDGEYHQDERDLSLMFRGSKNQRIIDVQKSIKCGHVILYSNDEEVAL